MLIKRNNFTIKKFAKDNYLMRFADGSAFFNHYFVKLAFLPDCKYLIKTEDWQDVFYNIEDRLNILASEKGELYFTVPMAYVECEKFL